MSEPFVAGPFGPGRYADLGAVRARQQGKEVPRITNREADDIRWRTLLAIANGIHDQLAGIRIALLPHDDRAHYPALAEVSDADGNTKGYGVYCVACSDKAGDYVVECEVRKANGNTDWPPAFLVAPTGDDAQLTPQTASPGVPDTVEEVISLGADASDDLDAGGGASGA